MYPNPVVRGWARLHVQLKVPACVGVALCDHLGKLVYIGPYRSYSAWELDEELDLSRLADRNYLLALPVDSRQPTYRRLVLHK